ncbi:MAG: HAD-IIA family hydrolase [Syntrophales bacterium]
MPWADHIVISLDKDFSLKSFVRTTTLKDGPLEISGSEYSVVTAEVDTPTGLLDGIKAILFDLDGTVYLGNQAVDGVVDLLSGLADHAFNLMYITNNSSKSRNQLLEKLNGMGIRSDLQQVYGAGYAAALYAREQGYRKIFCIGTQGLRGEIKAVGIQICEDEQDAEALIVGMDTDFDNIKLARALNVLKKGCAAIACSRENHYPVERGIVLPACGSIVAAIEGASGRKIGCIIGKPNPYMLGLLCHDWTLKAQEILVVGDSYATDIIMAKRFGCKSILMSRKKYKTTITVDNVQTLKKILLRLE